MIGYWKMYGRNADDIERVAGNDLEDYAQMDGGAVEVAEGKEKSGRNVLRPTELRLWNDPMGEADPRPLLRCLLNLYVPSSCCFLPGGREQTHILGFLACIDCMAEKRAHQCLPVKI